MTKKTLKMLSILGAASFVGAGYVSANDCCPGMFAAKGCQTQRITVGGFIAANYQWIETDEHRHGPEASLFSDHDDPDEFNNFYMKNIRLYISADLCDAWRALMSVDFAGKDGETLAWNKHSSNGANLIDSSRECRDRLPIFIDRAYIEKKWCAATFRAGYQKVNFGAEQAIPEEFVKTVDRSVATNFFMNLGRRAVYGEVTPGERSVWYGGNRFADRHVGLYLQGDNCNFHWNLAVVNGYQGLCRNSTQFNNELGYFAGVAYESNMCDTDVLIGVNAGYKPEGASWDEDGLKDGTRTIVYDDNTDDRAVWGVNPYILANWNCLSLLAEFLYGHVDNAKLVDLKSDAHPWGWNIIPSYMFNDCWELVARFSYLNTNGMGTTIHNAFGAAPDAGHARVIGSKNKNDTFVSSEVPFEKVTAGYIGVNYYTACQAVKLTLGYECAKFKNSFEGQINTPNSVTTRTPGHFKNDHVIVNAVRAQIQLMF